MGFKLIITWSSLWTRPKSRTTNLGIGLELFPIWKPKLMNPLESQRATRTKDAGEVVEGSQQLKVTDKDVAAEGKSLVGAKAEAANAPMVCYSMECTAKTSNDTSTQARCNIWAQKENPISPRSAQSPTRKGTVTSTGLGGMKSKRQVVTVAMKKRKTKILPRIRSQRKEAVMVTHLYALRMVRSSKLECK